MSLRTLFVILSLGISVFLPRAAYAAELSLDPTGGTYGPGDTFIMTVRIDNGDDCINAVNVELTYPKDTLRAVDFSRGDSIFSLWAVEPDLNTDTGTVTFAGGIPGGYCGRIAGDAALSNTLGKVIFSVVEASAPNASIQFAAASKVYINDGQGSIAELVTRGAEITLSPVPQVAQNPWLAEVKNDTTPPQPFAVEVQSTLGVFGGRYYIVFATTDKESGLDHFEISERGGWRRITSPYMLADQSLLGVGDVVVRAVDKAGNTRQGSYSASSTPQRQFSPNDFVPFLLFMVIVLLIGIKMHIDQRKRQSEAPPA